MLKNAITQEIVNGQTMLGIELGSTRIKAVLINSENQPIAQGGGMTGKTPYSTEFGPTVLKMYGKASRPAFPISKKRCKATMVFH